MLLKLAIIGTGTVARDQYIPFLHSQPDVSLAYFNRTAQTAQAIAQKFPGTLLPTLQAAADWQPAAALILTSETARYEIAKTLIEGGIPNIFFEKPLTAAAGQAHVTESDFHNAHSLLQLAKSKNCQTAIIFNYRFFGQTQAALAAIGSHNLGTLTNVSAQVHFACWSHVIDLIRLFAGNITQITALQGPREHSSPELQIHARDVTAAFVTIAGATGTILGTLAINWPHPLYELTLTFQRGRIHMRDLDGTLEILAGPAHHTTSLTRHTSRWDQYNNSFKKSLAAYLRSLRENKPPPIPASEGLHQLQFEAALKRSIQENRPIQLQQEFPIDL